MTTEEVTSEYLNILESIKSDNSTESYQYHDYSPQSQSNLNDRSTSIEININADNTYVLPSASFLIVEGRLRKADGTAYDANDEVALVNNGIMYMFKEISYSINSREVERIVSPGHTSSMINYLSYPDDYNTSEALMSCWAKDTTPHATSSKFMRSAVIQAGATTTPTENQNYNQGFATRKYFLMSSNPRGSFQFVIPFSHMFGFGEYDKVMWGLKHTLKLVRDSTDNLAIHRAAGVDNGEIELNRIYWSIPHIKVEPVKLSELRNIILNKETIPIAFNGRNSQSTNVTPDAPDFKWPLSVSMGIEKPRWLIFGFQTDKNTTQEQNPAIFDTVSLSNAYVTLNSQRYPQYDIPTNFTQNKYAKLYTMFNSFKKEYYGFNSLVGGTQVNFPAFKTLFPILVFDVRKQDETMKSGVMDMMVFFSFHDRVPANTRVYATILSDRMFKLKSDGTNLNIVSY